MKFSEYTGPECGRLREICNFTPDERAIFDLRAEDASIAKISMVLCMSEATVNRRLRRIREKIDRTNERGRA